MSTKEKPFRGPYINKVFAICRIIMIFKIFHT
jgi:hypothetical protein